MQIPAKRFLASLDIEEKILLVGSLLAAVSVFFPWLSGEWLGEEYVSYSGFEFFTSFIGIIIFALHAGLLTIILVPLLKGPQLIRRKYRDIVRFILSSQATILSLAAISVLTKITYDYTRMNIRFGIYLTLVGSLISTFYAFWKFQEFRKSQHDQTHFHHPEDFSQPVEEESEPINRTPPPPPPPLEPEEHNLHR